MWEGGRQRSSGSTSRGVKVREHTDTHTDCGKRGGQRSSRSTFKGVKVSEHTDRRTHPKEAHTQNAHTHRKDKHIQEMLESTHTETHRHTQGEWDGSEVMRVNFQRSEGQSKNRQTKTHTLTHLHTHTHK